MSGLGYGLDRSMQHLYDVCAIVAQQLSAKAQSKAQICVPRLMRITN